MPDTLDQILAYRVSPRTAVLLANGLLLGAGAIEFALVPSNVVMPILYPAAVATCMWTQSTRTLWITAIVAAVMSLCVYRFALQPPLADMRQVLLLNRVGAVATILIVAVFVDRSIRTHQFAVFQMSSLGDKNGVLERLNTELGQREEEIVRQNEELQSQTEELERQTEELRVTNEELTSWERRLEQLLELSRSLTADTKRSEVFSKVCEALGALVEAHATTLLLREGEEMRIHCHHGFGHDGPKSISLNHATSFSGQVMYLGQTGYVEDIRLRPDLEIPQPQKGAEYRAVLSTPLRVDGRTIGTIEAYGTQSRAWTTGEVAIIESLAIQAGKSIQEAELMEAIQIERRRLEAALRTIPIGIAVAEDAVGERIRINGSAAALFQLPSDENISPMTLAGAKLAARFVPMNRFSRTEELPISRALRGDDVFGVELEYRTQQGKRMVLLMSAAPILNEKQNIEGAVAAFVDITEHKALERELDLRRREAEEASQRKTKFLAAVSHDIRTPANAVNLMAEIIRRLAVDPSRQQEIAEVSEKLQANVHVLMDLIEDLLDVTRFDTGKMELNLSEFSLSDLLTQEVDQVIPLAQDKGLEVILEPLARSIWLRSDRMKLGRVLGNLLGNAIKFTERGSIKVTASIAHDDGRHLRLQVEDSGIGISREDIPQIFDEFTQLQNPARDRTKGSGLGLSICKRIVEMLEGSISVISEQHRGSTFIVELPAGAVILRTEVSSSPVSESSISQSSVPPLDLRILIIEDHPHTRAGTAQLLREEGAVVIEACDGRTALELLRAQSFDMVLLDMMLPDFDGQEILKRFQKERPPGLRGILVLTGDLTEERMSDIKSLGVDGLVRKPVDVPKLLQLLRSFS